MPGGRSVSKIKLVLAAIGVITCIVVGVKVAFMAARATQHRGPSDLSLHPERQNEIVAKRRALALQAKLGLTDEQVAQVAEIIAAAKKESDTFIQDDQKNVGEKLTAGRATMEAVSEEIRAILTEEQRQKYDVIRNERRQRFGDFLKIRK